MHSLNSKDLIDAVRSNIEKKKSEKNEKGRALCQELKRWSAKVAQFERTNMDIWSSKDCKISSNEKKLDDPAMPKGIEPLQARCKEWANRPSPNVLPCSSDDAFDPKENGELDVQQQWLEAGNSKGVFEIVGGIDMAQV